MTESGCCPLLQLDIDGTMAAENAISSVVEVKWHPGGAMPRRLILHQLWAGNDELV